MKVGDFVVVLKSSNSNNGRIGEVIDMSGTIGVKFIIGGDFLRFKFESSLKVITLEDDPEVFI